MTRKANTNDYFTNFNQFWDFYIPISSILSNLAAILDAILDMKNWKHNLINEN